MVPSASSAAARAAAVPYAGLGLDRVTGRRDDPAWVAGLAADPRARVRPLWRGQCLVAGNPPAPLDRLAGRPGGSGPDRLVLLGLDHGIPEFAVDLSDLGLDEALGAAGADAAADLRSLYASLPAAQAGTLACARGLPHWHRQQRYGGRCGSATQPRHAGHLRACTNHGCGALLFPRIEPAVIALVETVRAPRRCLLARHRASAAGGYSLRAGFVEIGESLEDAVRREISEEAGVEVGDVGYAGSQPWPFPAGLMVAFRATAGHEAVTADGQEIREARWFTRGELAEYAAASGGLGRADSIDRIMLTGWLAEAAENDPAEGGGRRLGTCAGRWCAAAGCGAGKPSAVPASRAGVPLRGARQCHERVGVVPDHAHVTTGPGAPGGPPVTGPPLTRPPSPGRDGRGAWQLVGRPSTPGPACGITVQCARWEARPTRAGLGPGRVGRGHIVAVAWHLQEEAV
jgi:NAD+ diphosphatase